MRCVDLLDARAPPFQDSQNVAMVVLDQSKLFEEFCPNSEEAAADITDVNLPSNPAKLRQDPCGNEIEETIFALYPTTCTDIEALVNDNIDKLRQFFWRRLQVRGDDAGDFTASVAKCRVPCRPFTLIDVVMERAKPGVGGANLIEDVARRVGAAIVDQNAFPRAVAGVVQRRRYASREFAKVALLVVHRAADAEHGLCDNLDRSKHLN